MSNNCTKQKIIVLGGGGNREHSISIESARNVLRSINGDFYFADLCVIDSQGNWTLHALQGDRSINQIPFTPLTFTGAQNDFKKYGINAVYNALHGERGEGGFVQGILEEAGVPYTGSNMTASMLTYDKIISNKMVSSHIKNVCVPEFVAYECLSQVGDAHYHAKNIIKSQDLIIKPSKEGSSFGIKKISANDSKLGIEIRSLLSEINQPVIVQKFIAGREITSGVIGRRGGSEALPVWEIISDKDWFDHDAKYIENTKEVQADLPKDIIKFIQKVSIKIHNLFGCSGASRIDFRLADDGTLFFIEINSSPGLTKKSIFPQMLIAANKTMESFVDMQLRFPINKKGII